MKKKQFSKIVFQTKDNNGYKRNFSFRGKWILENIQYNEEDEPNSKIMYSLAMTQKGRIFMLRNREGEVPYFDDFDDFDEMVDVDYIPEEVLKKLAESESFIEELKI